MGFVLESRKIQDPSAVFHVQDFQTRGRPSGTVLSCPFPLFYWSSSVPSSRVPRYCNTGSPTVGSTKKSNNSFFRDPVVTEEWRCDHSLSNG